MIMQTAARDIWREYTATMLNSIGRMFASEGWAFPPYSEMIDFEGHVEKRREENKSASQLQSELMAKLKKGGETA